MPLENYEGLHGKARKGFMEINRNGLIRNAERGNFKDVGLNIKRNKR